MCQKKVGCHICLIRKTRGLERALNAFISILTIFIHYTRHKFNSSLHFCIGILQLRFLASRKTKLNNALWVSSNNYKNYNYLFLERWAPKLLQKWYIIAVKVIHFCSLPKSFWIRPKVYSLHDRLCAP